MKAGDTKRLRVPVIDSETGEPVPVNDAKSIRWEVARAIGAPIQIAKSLGAGVSVDPDEPWVFWVQLNPPDTEDLSGNFVHEAEVIDAAGNVSTVEDGAFVVDRALIKPKEA